MTIDATQLTENLAKHLEGKSAKDILSILQSFNTATKQGASLELLVPKSGVTYDVGVIGSTIDKLRDLQGSDEDKLKARELLKALLPGTTNAEWLEYSRFTTQHVMAMMINAFKERSKKELDDAENILTKAYATNDPILNEDRYPKTTKVFEGMMTLNRFVTVSFNPKTMNLVLPSDMGNMVILEIIGLVILALFKLRKHAMLAYITRKLTSMNRKKIISISSVVILNDLSLFVKILHSNQRMDF